MKLFGGKKRSSSWAISLDIGTEFVKALIFEVIDGVGHVRGVGRERQRLSDMQGGGVTDIHGVAQNCEKAIEQAAQQAKHLPQKAIVGIAGELVKGTTNFVKVTRPNSSLQIQLAELQSIVNRVQAESFRRARSELAIETGQEEIDVELVNAAIVSVTIDGYKVSNPLSYQGKELAVGVYNSFAPIVQLGAIESVVRELGLELIAVSAEPYAVAKCLNEESTDFAAIFIDIGGGTTDVAVVRNGGLEGTKMFALGGRAFTKRVSAALGESFAEAEKSKLAYSAGTLDKEKEQLVKHALASDAKVWLSALQISLEDFGETDLLPTKILLCGGGSNLPEIMNTLRTTNWYKDLPFAKTPEVQFIKPSDIITMQDDTASLQNIDEVTPLALANVALDLLGESGILENVMKKAIEGLKK